MLNSAIIRIVDFCAKHRRQALAIGILLAAAATYDVARFSTTTDTQRLAAQDLGWICASLLFPRCFPRKGF